MNNCVVCTIFNELVESKNYFTVKLVDINCSCSVILNV